MYNQQIFVPLRPGKVDSLFPISHFLDFEGAAIIDFAEVIKPGAVNTCFTQ